MKLREFLYAVLCCGIVVGVLVLFFIKLTDAPPCAPAHVITPETCK